MDTTTMLQTIINQQSYMTALLIIVLFFEVCLAIMYLSIMLHNNGYDKRYARRRVRHPQKQPRTRY